jgi:hypothetical protein
MAYSVFDQRRQSVDGLVWFDRLRSVFDDRPLHGFLLLFGTNLNQQPKIRKRTNRYAVRVMSDVGGTLYVTDSLRSPT